MNLQQSLVLILSAILAAALLYWLVKSHRIDKWLASAMFIGVQLIVSQVVQSHYFARPLSAQQQLSASLDALPVMVTLQEKDPQTRQRLEKSALAAIEQGMSPHQARDKLQAEIADVVSQRVQLAPDAAIIDYMAVTLLQLRELQQKGGGLCFRFLFPQTAGDFDSSKYLSPALLQQRQATDNQLVIGSYQQPYRNTAQDNQQAGVIMQQIARQLGQQYGDDLQMLVPPQRSDVDQQQVCRMIGDLYQRVMALPAAQSAPVLRLMLGNAAA